MVICYFLAFARAAEAMIPFIAPSVWSPWRVSCIYALCEWRVDETRLLPPAVQTAEGERPDVIAKLKDRAERPRIRAALLAAEFIRVVPEMLFLVSLGLGFRGLGRGEVFGRRTITWLRRAAAFAFVAAVAQPVTVLAHHVILLTPLTDAESGNVIVYQPIVEVLAGLFLASAAWVIAFALDEGRKKQDELAGYV